MIRHCAIAQPQQRFGFLMPIVMVVLATLTLAVSIFAEQMLAEYRATRSMAGQLQAACAAQSGLEFLLLRARTRQSLGTMPESVFQLQALSPSRDAGFWIVSQRSNLSSPMHCGLTNESGKLNVNGLSLDLANVEASRQRLMQLPRMTPQVADALLDWIDSDDSPRAVGAERNWYSAAQAPKLPTQRPFKELSELLFVRGVTTDLLYGEDTNANGWLDDCENDGARTLPMDNADGQLDRGWSEYLTVVGAESNYREGNVPKVNLNESNLATLYDQLLPELGHAASLFIVALRLEGPRQQGDAIRDSEQTQKDERLRSLQQRLSEQLDRTSTSQPARRAATRGGLDLTAQPTFEIRSMVDVIDCEVLTIVNGEQELLKSPWSLAQIESAIAKLEAVCTTRPGQQLTHRINLKAAPERVLRTIPGIDANRAQSIAARRTTIGRRPSVGWLVTDGLMTLEQFRQVAPYATSGGDVWSGTSIGTCKITPSFARIHFVIDATLPLPRLLVAQESMPFTLPTAERPQL